MPGVPDASVAAGAGLRLPVGAPALGTLIADKYLLDGVLGVGGMGVVYRGRHTLLGVPVAIKVILPEFAERPEFVQRFANEAKAAARIQSDHITRVSDVGTTSYGISFLVMELMEGEDLGSILALEGPQPLGRCIDWMLQTIAGLSDAHHAGIVHRDLKPSNLFLARRKGKPDRIKICDFGISKTSFDGPGGQNITRTNSTLGSPAYMAPEQLRSSRSVDHRADIWSLGIILYEMLSGAPPFAGENVGAVFAAILETDPQPLRSFLPDLPPEIDEAVLRCLRKSPHERFKDVTELASVLAPFAATESVVPASRPQSGGSNVAFQATTPTHESSPRLALAANIAGHGHPIGLESKTPASSPRINATQRLEPPSAVAPSHATGQHAAVAISSSGVRTHPSTETSRARGALWFIGAMGTMLVVGIVLTISAIQIGKKQSSPTDIPSSSSVTTTSDPSALPATNTPIVMPVVSIPAAAAAAAAPDAGIPAAPATTTTANHFTRPVIQPPPTHAPTPATSSVAVVIDPPPAPPPPPPASSPPAPKPSSGIYTDPWKN